MISKAAFFKSFVWLDLGLNHSLPDYWQTLYSLGQWLTRFIFSSSTQKVYIQWTLKIMPPKVAQKSDQKFKRKVLSIYLIKFIMSVCCWSPLDIHRHRKLQFGMNNRFSSILFLSWIYRKAKFGLTKLDQRTNYFELLFFPVIAIHCYFKQHQLFLSSNSISQQQIIFCFCPI